MIAKERMLKLITHVYNSGYMHGHEDTVEGVCVPLSTCDYDIYHEEEVSELIEELGLET